MTTTLEVTAAQASFFDLIDRVEHGESVILTQSGVPVACLVPCDNPEETPR
jgi:prevent-host-death family protein